MNGQVFPLFERTHVLRIAMLTELRDYAYEYGRLIYEDYSDGIISGCAITTTIDTITLNRGTLRYKGKIYLITEPLSMEYYPTDNWVVFKLEFKGDAKKDGYIYREIKTILTEKLEIRKEEMEICRFKLQVGARLRIKYVDFSDRSTEFDTVNTIHAPFAACQESSLSPDITRAFAREAVPYAMDVVDTAFCIQALNASQALNREAIILYIAAKLKKPFAQYDNLTLYQALLTILNTIKDSGERELFNKQRGRRQLIVD